MSGNESVGMPGFDPVTGLFALPLWMAGAVAALLVILAGRAFMRMGVSPTISALPQYALVAIGLLLAWSFLDRSMTHDRAEARRALEARATALTAQAIAPGSALACLDAGAGETVQAACEKAVFDDPEAIAAAVSYVGAQLVLLADGADFAKNGEGVGAALNDLRRIAEADRFGVVAHVLASRDRCTVEKCDAFRFLPDRRQIGAHLKEDSFGQYVSRHAANWPVNGQPAGQPAVAANPPPPEKPTTAVAAPSSWSFPSAASIPAISIMNPEPPGPPPGVAAANAATEPAQPSPPSLPPSPPARKPPPKRNPPATVQAAPLPPAPRASSANAPIATTPNVAAPAAGAPAAATTAAGPTPSSAQAIQ